MDKIKILKGLMFGILGIVLILGLFVVSPAKAASNSQEKSKSYNCKYKSKANQRKYCKKYNNQAPQPKPVPAPAPIPTPIPQPEPQPTPTPAPEPQPTPSPVTKSFKDNFSQNYVLEETGSMGESPNANWWLNSGGRLSVSNGIAKTIQGDLSSIDKWYKEYASYSSEDTDGGKHPQNLFRLVTKSKWQNFVQQSYFKINKYYLSNSSERYNPNGLLLFNRYLDGNNLYYTGVRVDGNAVVKKKINSNYYTIAEKKIFDGTYDRDNNPILLPQNTWIGVKSELKNNSDGTTGIKVYVDKDGSGNWQLAIDTKDDNKSFGGGSIKDAGYAGIRTDFMDVEFKDYQISEF